MPHGHATIALASRRPRLTYLLLLNVANEGTILLAGLLPAARIVVRRSRVRSGPSRLPNGHSTMLENYFVDFVGEDAPAMIVGVSNSLKRGSKLNV